jgi:hypothetical protein
MTVCVLRSSAQVVLGAWTNVEEAVGYAIDQGFVGTTVGVFTGWYLKELFLQGEDY